MTNDTGTTGNNAAAPVAVESPVAAAVAATVPPVAASGLAGALATVTATLAPIPEVVDLLKKAGDTQRSVYAGIQQAAKLAATQMSANLDAPAKVKQVTAIYAGTLKEVNDNNVTNTFAACLWPYASPKTIVEIPLPTRPGEAKTTQKVEAAQAVNVSKASAIDIAKQMRDAHDVGRADGGGRKADPAKVATTQVVKPSAAAPNFFEELETRIKDAGDLARIVAALDRAGFSVTRKSGVTPATATPDATAQLAQALVDTVPATALAQAAAKSVANVKAAAKK